MSETVQQFAASLRAASAKVLEAMPRAVEQCAEPIREGINENFRTQSTAGTSWPPRQDTGFAHPLLNQSGMLLQAAVSKGAVGHVEQVTQHDGGASLEIGVSPGAGGGGIPGAAIHNFGGVIRPVDKQYLSWLNSAGERVFAKSVTIPQREYLAISDDTLARCDELVGDAIMKVLI